MFILSAALIEEVLAVRVQEWHEQCGHVSNSELKMTLELYPSINVKVPLNIKCLSCLKGKSQRKKFPDTKCFYYPVLHSVHMDICGPFSQSS
jgi:hypothetical protein